MAGVWSPQRAQPGAHLVHWQLVHNKGQTMAGNYEITAADFQCWWCGKRVDIGVCMGPHDDYDQSIARHLRAVHGGGTVLKWRPKGA